MFGMFQQEGGRLGSAGDGPGIGLALVRHLCELQGRRARAASEGLGRGTCMSVWLPSAAGAAGGLAALPTELLRGLRILMVDDNLDALESYATLLAIDGAEVTTAAGGAAAVDAALQRGTEPGAFHLVLSDVSMPGMDGCELVARLRQLPATAEAYCVALTGFSRSDDSSRALAAGFDAHLAKPVALDALLQTIARIPPERPSCTPDPSVGLSVDVPQRHMAASDRTASADKRPSAAVSRAAGRVGHLRGLRSSGQGLRAGHSGRCLSRRRVRRVRSGPCEALPCAVPTRPRRISCGPGRAVRGG